MSGTALPAAATGPSRWGVQTGLIQPRQPAFWLYAGLLAVGAYLFVDQQSVMSQYSQAYGLSWVLVLVYALPVAFVVYRLDLFEREPTSLLVGAVLWGGVIATSFAISANQAWLEIVGKVAPPDIARDWSAAIVGPGVEETLKLLGVITIFLIARSELDGVLDGFVYGAMVGLGFTVVEDVSYFMNAVAAMPGSVDQTGPVWDTFVIRVIGGGLYSHVLFTGLTGMGFAYFVTRPAVAFPRRLAISLAVIAAGVAAHVVWNSPWLTSILATPEGTPSTFQWVELGTLKGMPFLLLLGLLVVFATRTEDRNFAAIVAGEVERGVITPAELAALRNLLARRTARKRAGRERGRAAERLVGRLQDAQVELGLMLARAASPDDPAVERQRAKIAAIRSELEALPLTGMAAAASTGSPAPAAPVQPIGDPWASVAPLPGPVPSVEAGAGAGVQPAAAVIQPAPAVAEPAPAVTEPAPAVEPARAVEPTLAVEPTPAVEPARVEPSPATVPPPAAGPVWSPTHLVPPGGMAAWEAPDPARPPFVMLPERLELVIEGWAGAWALVRAINGWRGWVDGRRLIERPPA